MRKAMLLLCLLFMAGCSATKITQSQKQENFSFGVIADIQYADKEAQGSRHYRESLSRLKECVEDLNRRQLAFTIQLGDLIDGNQTSTTTLSDLDRALELYNSLSMPKYHVVGNHCLTTGQRELQEKLGLKSVYYDFTAPDAHGWRFIVLDGNDAGYGILGADQLEWLGSKLAEARANKEKVIVFCHFALLQSAAQNHRMTTPEPVLTLINDSDCVVAYFAGHDHAGGYTFQDGVHHVTLKGMVEASTNSAYAVIEVSPTTLREIGLGDEPSREMTILAPRAEGDGLKPAP
jgi:manganese-dependent ADP-ribose/CDP-alcohol diphosphatase